MNERNHDRRPENTNISISIPVKVLHKLDQAAECQRRSRSNLITILLEREIKTPRTAA